MSTIRRILQLNIAVTDRQSLTTAIQITNGSTKMAIQFFYSNIDSQVSLTMQQSLDGLNFDTCCTENDEPLTITLDPTSQSFTLNISEVLATWVRFSIDYGTATSGSIDKAIVLMQ